MTKKEQVEYLSTCGFKARWFKGTLVREWNDGSASIQAERQTDGWLIVRPGKGRRRASD